MNISTLVLALSMAVSAPHNGYDIPVPEKSEPVCQELYVAVKNRRSRERAYSFVHSEEKYVPQTHIVRYEPKI